MLTNIKLIGIRCETGKKTSAKPRDMLPVSKARTNKFDIFRQCTYIVNGLGGRIVVYINTKKQYQRSLCAFHWTLLDYNLGREAAAYSKF